MRPSLGFKATSRQASGPCRQGAVAGNRRLSDSGRCRHVNMRACARFLPQKV